MKERGYTMALQNNLLLTKGHVAIAAAKCPVFTTETSALPDNGISPEDTKLPLSSKLIILDPFHAGKGSVEGIQYNQLDSSMYVLGKELPSLLIGLWPAPCLRAYPMFNLPAWDPA